MSLYSEYLQEIATRKTDGLNPKPIDGADLLTEVIGLVKDPAAMDREQALNFFTYNVLPGTTSAAGVKAAFLKDIITGAVSVDEISVASAFEQLSHMKGGPSIEVLLDLALGDDAASAAEAAKVLKNPSLPL